MNETWCIDIAGLEAKRDWETLHFVGGNLVTYRANAIWDRTPQIMGPDGRMTIG